MRETVQIWPNNGGGAEGRMLADITETTAACAPLLTAQGVLENP